MDIRELQIRYSKLPQAKALLSLLGNDSRQTVQLQGLTGSAAPLFFSGVAQLMEVSRNQRAMVFILNDADEAGYFYHDLTQVMGSRRVLFFPSGYRRAAKYGQKDAANEILRTEVITSLSAAEPVFVVTSPEAVAEKVVSKKNIDERRLTIAEGESHNLIALEHTLVDYGFQQTDYVYEPGQFALRGSLLDVYSFSSEQPFRIDFFGDDVETIRTFEVETQLSVDKLQSVTIVPELSQLADEKVSLFELLPADSVLVARDWVFVRDRVAQIYDDGFSRQAVTERTEGKTEMERQQIESEMRSESQLLTGTQLVASIEPLRRVDGTFILPDHDVTISPIFTDETVDYELSFNGIAQGGMPEGWIATDGTDVHSYPNTYGVGGGPRTFLGFTGYQGSALYWRNTSASYGTLEGYPLTLAQGNYTLSFANVAWKASPAFNVQILDVNGNVIAESDNYTATPNANGNSSADLSSAELYELNFNISQAGNYIINFNRKGNGYDEYLLLECYLNYEYEMGDVNMDKNVDITDVVLAVNYILSNGTTNAKGIHKYGDMDQNGTIDITDVVTIVNKVLSK